MLGAGSQRKQPFEKGVCRGGTTSPGDANADLRTPSRVLGQRLDLLVIGRSTTSLFSHSEREAGRIDRPRVAPVWPPPAGFLAIRLGVNRAPLSLSLLELAEPVFFPELA